MTFPNAPRSRTRYVPKNANELRDKLSSAILTHARGDGPHWARALGASLPDAARSLGVLWNCDDPVPDEVRAQTARELACDPALLATYSRLVRRLMRELPRAFASRNDDGALRNGEDALLDDLLTHPNVALERAARRDGRGRRHVRPVSFASARPAADGRR
jgi:hypothetical protein